jgi:hypothetical protein
MPKHMRHFTLWGFIATTGAALSMRAVVPFARSGSGRRILTLVYDKSLGMVRAVERVAY